MFNIEPKLVAFFHGLGVSPCRVQETDLFLTGEKEGGSTRRTIHRVRRQYLVGTQLDVPSAKARRQV